MSEAKITDSRMRSAAGAIPPLLFFLFLTSGCQQIVDKKSREVSEKAVAILQSRRALSLKLWREGKSANRMDPAYAAAFTAMLLPPGTGMSLHTKETPDKTHYEVEVSGDGAFTAGSAVAVSGDGYFLTAAHCLDRPGSTLVAVTKDRSLQKAKARVVWAGDMKAGGPDMALIHAPLAPLGRLSSAVGEIKRGAPVLASGLGSDELWISQSAGRVLGTGPVTEGPEGLRWRYISHTAPLAPGDSGGPLIGGDGRLLGINTETAGLLIHLWHPPLLRYRNWAVSPDPAWIQSLIEKDRRERRTAKR